MLGHKTIKTTVKNIHQQRKEHPKNRTSLLSSTLEIPVDAVFGNVTAESTAYIDITCPGLQPQTVPLSRTEIVIGRDEDCPICLPAQNVSRRHARFVWNGDDCIVEDMDSTNGTFVNSIKISRCVLRNNDQIRIGNALIVFVQHRVAGAR